MTKKVRLLPFHRGDTKTYQAKVENPATGLPVNVAGMTLWITLKENPTDADPGAAQSSQVIPSGPDAAAGLASVTLNSAQTAGLVPGRVYYYDMQLVQAGAPPVVTTIQYGTVLVLRDTTVTA